MVFRPFYRLCLSMLKGPISSILPQLGAFGVILVSTQWALYATTKFAVVGLSETLAAEMADTRIGVSVLCPDPIQSNLFTVGRNRPQS